MIPETPEFLKDILCTLPTHIYWKDEEGRYQWCNDAHLSSLGLHRLEEIQGRTDFDLIWKDQAHTLRILDEQILRHNQAYEAEEVVTLASGKRAIFLSKKTPVHNALGQPIGIMGVSIDITARKETELELKQAKDMAEQANAAKTTFLENMRHDLRTPLTAIIGLAQLISQEENDLKKIKDYAHHLMEASETLLALINRILEVIHAEDHSLPRLHQPLNLPEVLHTMMEDYAVKAYEKNLNLTFHMDSRLPTHVMGDTPRLQHIVTELLLNALKFTSKGTIKVSAEIKEEGDKTCVVKDKEAYSPFIFQFSVQDTGIGMEAEHIHHMFQPFVRAHSSSQGLYPGIGMGLTRVQQIISELKGSIHVESTLNQGTTFTCRLPLERVEELAPEGNSRENTSSEAELKKIPRVLLVEDTPLIALATQHLLEKCQCDVDLATTGAKALAKVKNNSYAMVLMDIGLPDMNGCEVTQHIRAYEHALPPPTPHLPIIALTAHGGPEHQQQCFAAGLDDFFNKPISLEDFQNILKKWVK